MRIRGPWQIVGFWRPQHESKTARSQSLDGSEPAPSVRGLSKSFWCYGAQACRSGLSQGGWQWRTAVTHCHTQIPCIANQGHLWDCSRNEVTEMRCFPWKEKSSASSRLSSGAVQTSSERCQQEMQGFLLPPGVQTGDKINLLWSLTCTLLFAFFCLYLKYSQHGTMESKQFHALDFKQRCVDCCTFSPWSLMKHWVERVSDSIHPSIAHAL